MRLTALAFALATTLSAAAPDAAIQALARLETHTAKLPVALATDFRMLAAQSLQKTQPELAAKLVRQTIEQLRQTKGARPGRETIRILAELAPREASSVVPPGMSDALIGAYVRANQVPEAVAVFRGLLARHAAPLELAAPLLGRVAREDATLAKKLFQEIVSSVDLNALPPDQTWRLIDAANAITAAAPGDAARVADTLLRFASKPEYGAGAKLEVIARFTEAPQKTITAANTRESVLIGSGVVLAAAAPEKLAQWKSVLGKWDVAKLRPAGASFRSPGAAPPVPNPLLASISERMRPFRSLPTDADRARLALEVVAEIEKLEPAARYGPISGLSHVITEGDMGKQALTAVTRTYGNAIVAAGDRAGVSDWTHLANLVRHEQVEPPFSNPALDAAMAILDVRESIHQDTGFTLTALDGKQYSLAALRGKVVLLNFWATWCPPCRKELPDLDKLYREFGSRGFVVLAVSDEDRPTVEGFLAGQNYSFPVLLDPGRKVHSAFDVEGIPKNFIFDRQGKLAGQTIDMRTEAQFRQLLKRAGLE